MPIKIALSQITTVSVATPFDKILIAYGEGQLARLLSVSTLVAQTPRVTSSVNGVTYQIIVREVDGVPVLGLVAVPTSVLTAVKVLCGSNNFVYAFDVLLVDGAPVLNLEEVDSLASQTFNILCTDNNTTYELAVIIVDGEPTPTLIAL